MIIPKFNEWTNIKDIDTDFEDMQIGESVNYDLGVCQIKESEIKPKETELGFIIKGSFTYTKHNDLGFWVKWRKDEN